MLTGLQLRPYLGLKREKGVGWAENSKKSWECLTLSNVEIFSSLAPWKYVLSLHWRHYKQQKFHEPQLRTAIKMLLRASFPELLNVLCADPWEKFLFVVNTRNSCASPEHLAHLILWTLTGVINCISLFWGWHQKAQIQIYGLSLASGQSHTPCVYILNLSYFSYPNFSLSWFSYLVIFFTLVHLIVVHAFYEWL